MQVSTRIDCTLDLFGAANVVVAALYHELIFTNLCRKPCVVLPAVEHKLTSVMPGLTEISFMKFVPNSDEISVFVEQYLSIKSREFPD